MVVENVIRHWLYLTIYNPAATDYGVGETVVHKLGVFYAENDIIGSWDLKWLQLSMNYFIGLFRRIEPEATIAKSNKMTFQPGGICSGVSAEAFTRRIKGEGVNYHNHLRLRILCPGCAVEVRVISLTSRHR